MNTVAPIGSESIASDPTKIGARGRALGRASVSLDPIARTGIDAPARPRVPTTGVDRALPISARGMLPDTETLAIRHDRLSNGAVAPTRGGVDPSDPELQIGRASCRERV